MKFQKYRIQQRKSTIKSKKGRLVRARVNLITLYLCLASISIKISYILPMTEVDKNTQTTTGAPHTFKVPQRVATTLANVVIKRSWAKEAPRAWLHFSKRRFRKQPFFFFSVISSADPICYSTSFKGAETYWWTLQAEAQYRSEAAPASCNA